MKMAVTQNNLQALKLHFTNYQSEKKLNALYVAVLTTNYDFIQ
jgi:hypothetical protein